MGGAQSASGGAPWPRMRTDPVLGRRADRHRPVAGAFAFVLALGSAESGVLLELYRLARSPEEAEAAIAATEEHRRVGAARKNFRPYQPKVSASLFRACRLTGHLAAVPDLVRRQRELGLEVGIPG